MTSHLCSWNLHMWETCSHRSHQLTLQVLPVGRGSHPHLWLSVSQEKEFSETRMVGRDTVEALFLWNQTPEFPRSHFPLSHRGRRVAGASAELRSKPVSGMERPNSALGQFRLVPSCSPFVHYVWGPHGHGQVQENKLLCLRDYVFPNV